MKYVCLNCGSTWDSEELLKSSDGRLTCGDVCCCATVVEATSLSNSELYNLHDERCDYEVNIEVGERSCCCDIMMVIINRVIEGILFEELQPA